MLVSNVIFVVIGVATRENVQSVIFLNAVIFIATFALFLLVFRSYLGRPLTAWAALALGVVWFSLIDWQNAIWAFQLAWYLVLFLFVVMLYLLLIRPQGHLTLALAILVAVLASYSNIQGLFLWPIGLLCILWPHDAASREWRRLYVPVWCSVAAVTAAIYFVGYQSAAPSPDGLFPTTLFGSNTAGISPSFVLSHPVLTVQSVLVNIGNVVPVSWNPQHPWSNELFGTVILAAAAYVVVQCVRQRQPTWRRRGGISTRCPDRVRNPLRHRDRHRSGQAGPCQWGIRVALFDGQPARSDRYHHLRLGTCNGTDTLRRRDGSHRCPGSPGRHLSPVRHFAERGVPAESRGRRPPRRKRGTFAGLRCTQGVYPLPPSGKAQPFLRSLDEGGSTQYLLARSVPGVPPTRLTRYPAVQRDTTRDRVLKDEFFRQSHSTIEWWPLEGRSATAS